MLIKDKKMSEPSPYDLLSLPFDVSMEAIDNEIYKKALLKWGGKYVRKISDAYTRMRDPVNRLEIDAFFYHKENAARVKILTFRNSMNIQIGEPVSEPTTGLCDVTHYDELLSNKADN